jgi:hypothetical protein
MSNEWVEVNIVPSSSEQRERLLLDVIEPLVHDKFSGRIEAWFYFWEVVPILMVHLRLRILWRQPVQADDEAKLAEALDKAESQGKLALWYPGRDGVPGDTYPGEADRYGEEMWKATYMDWESGSEMALALIKAGSENSLTESREFHLQRRVHLHSNRLGMSYFDEGYLYLQLSYGYLARAANENDPRATDPQVNNMIVAIGLINRQLENSLQRLRANLPTGTEDSKLSS